MEGTGNKNPTMAIATESDAVGDPYSPSAGDRNIPPAPENQPESSDNGNAGDNKKPAWNTKRNTKPSNGSVESGPVVMGGGVAFWPPLSESTKAPPKLSPSDSLKNLSDSGSAPAPESPSQSPVASQKPATTSKSNHNPTLNHGRPARQKSIKRDGAGYAQANGGFSHQPSPGEGSHNHNSSAKPSSGGGYESSSRDNMQNHANREVGVQNHAGGDHLQRRPSFRRGNGGQHSRGDGSHQNYGGRRGDQDRGNHHDWNHQRGYNGRDAPLQQPRVSPRGYVRNPPVSAPFVQSAGPAPMQAFMNPMGIPDMHMVYFPPGMSFIAPLPAPVYFPAPDPQLKAKIANQIDYYFSNENLVKDTYLRQNMDQYGWVPVMLIAGFKKVIQLTDNIQLILEAVQSSSVVEAQGDKIRRRGDWMRWIMPSSVKYPTTSGLQSPTSPNVATLSAHIQSLTLDEEVTDVSRGF